LCRCIKMKIFLLAIAYLGTVHARCPNDCNGKGICNAASVCECYANYMGNDCSQRLCNFGKAWIDTNLGDLNANGVIDTDQQVYAGYANTLVGEQYDPNYGVARTNNLAAWDEAHFYRECSNKGICNRKTGICDCFPGFEGEGCRRMSCPLDCNGHGQCQLIEHDILNSEYPLWDQDKVQKCQCDPGYSGPDCSVRECPKGIDPVQFTYTNAESVYKIEFHNIAASAWNKGELPNGPTYFTLTYTDDFGDMWTTHAITLYHQANCAADQSKWDPETKSTSSCSVTPFIANPTRAQEYTKVEKKSCSDFFDSTSYTTFEAAKKACVVGCTGIFDSGCNGPTYRLCKAAASSFADAAAHCIYTPPVLNAETVLGNVRNADFLDTFYKTNFLYDASFVGEQVNNTLKSLPNDLIRAPYVWTVYNPVEFKGTSSSPTSPNADKGFLYPARSVPDFDKALGIGVSGTISSNWWQCHAQSDPPTSTYCAKYPFSGPSDATDDPKYRFPIFANKADLDASNQDSGKAAKSYLNCDLFNTCIFIRIQSPKGEKQLTLNYHYKPAHYLLKAGKTAPTGDVADLANYDVVFGTEQRGNDESKAPALKIVTLTSVGADRKWVRHLDGDPVITYREGVKSDLHACSRRGLCDYDTGKCECFFGYMGHSCHTRTPSEKQGL